jgi:hypothetical protein
MNGKIVRIVQSTEGGIDPGHVEASYSMANTAGLAVDRKPMTPVRASDQNIRSQVVLVVDIRVE